MVRDLPLAGATGFLGSKLMEPVPRKLYEVDTADARAEEDRVWPGSRYRMAAEKPTELVGLELAGASSIGPVWPSIPDSASAGRSCTRSRAPWALAQSVPG